MFSSKGKPLRLTRIMAFIGVLLIGIALGLGLAGTVNAARTENFTDFTPALPTKIYDIKGRLITEFFTEEKRDPVSMRQLPEHLVQAIITREDQTFFSHRGFTVKSMLRALVGQLTGRSLGGGSTISQQLAGTLYADRRDYSIKRKLVELWWALQLERRYSKEEILEMYMNRMIMGSGVYGVEAASQYFFDHSARDLTPAESAILAIQLSSPARYDPFRNPNNARPRSREILNRMVARGVLDQKTAQTSFDAFWDSFDYTRVSAGAFLMRDDSAPWFSEYVRRQLQSMLYGTLDLYSDGFSVYTTLDLDQQAAADAYMKQGIADANAGFKRTAGRPAPQASTFTPIVELLGMGFNVSGMVVSGSKNQSAAFSTYRNKINPTLDALSLLFGLPDLKMLANAGSARLKTEMEKSTVEGALITIDNDTGYITALVGGSRFDMSNQLIRATQSKLMPGSTFKPLYYSAAIDAAVITEGTMLMDAPTVFMNNDGVPYIPLNFMGAWNGPVLAWQALSKSLNVPSVQVLQMVGFDAAIARAAALLGITDPDEIRKTFPRLYPLGLGIIGVTPLQMARAYAVFANGGKIVTPIAIRYVEDRNGNIILNPEKEIQDTLRRSGPSRSQIISSRNAALMTDMLKRTVSSGTLAGRTGQGALFRQTGPDGKVYTMPAAGKTGTTQNWADAWTVGFTPYYTSAIWLGFDRGGNTLGTDQTGATAAGKIWANYMKDIHLGLPYKDFPAAEGLVTQTVCAISGLLPTQYCDQGTINLMYYAGSEPTESCAVHADKTQDNLNLLNTLTGTHITLPGEIDQTGTSTSIAPPDSTLKIDLPGLQ